MSTIHNESRLAALMLEFFFMDTIQKLKANQNSDRTKTLKNPKNIVLKDRSRIMNARIIKIKNTPITETKRISSF